MNDSLFINKYIQRKNELYMKNSKTVSWFSQRRKRAVVYPIY